MSGPCISTAFYIIFQTPQAPQQSEHGNLQRKRLTKLPYQLENRVCGQSGHTCRRQEAWRMLSRMPPKSGAFFVCSSSALLLTCGRANAFAIFLKSQRKWSSPNLKPSSITMFKERMQDYGYSTNAVLPHGSYLINLGNPDPYVPQVRFYRRYD